MTAASRLRSGWWATHLLLGWSFLVSLSRLCGGGGCGLSAGGQFGDGRVKWLGAAQHPAENKRTFHGGDGVEGKLPGAVVGNALLGETRGEGGNQVLEAAARCVGELRRGGRRFDDDGGDGAALAVAAGCEFVARTADKCRDQFRGGAGGAGGAVDLGDGIGAVHERDLGGEFLLAAGEVKVQRP